MDSSRIRKYLYAASISLVTLASLFIVAVSPFALSLISKLRSTNWALLSNIGQTYGAISAVLAAAGIAGVSATIMLQIRESRRNRADATRTHHFELYRMAMEDASLTEISHGTSKLPLKERKYSIYINFQLEFWLMLWEIGTMNEATLRASAADLFKTELGRKHWERNGAARMKITTGAHKESKFLMIVNDEYLHHAISGQGNVRQHAKTTRAQAIIATTAAAVVALSAGIAIGKSTIFSRNNRLRKRQ